MKHFLMSVAAMIIALSSQAVARIGNTEEQVNALLGRPTDPGKPDSNSTSNKCEKKPGNKAAWIPSDRRARAWYENVRGYSTLMIQARY